MTPPPTPLERRAAATHATMARFKDQPFQWGKNDCARLVAFHLRKLGLPVRLAKAGTYKSALGARRALTRLGHATLLEAVDSYGMPRIAPAMAVIGDVVALPGADELGALGVAVGNGRVLAYHEDAPGAVILQPAGFVAAWRVLDHG